MRALMANPTTTQQPAATVSLTGKAGEPSELEKLFGPGLMTEKQFAKYTGLSQQMAAKNRKDGLGPKFVRLGRRRLAYRIADIEEWLRARENVRAEA